MLGRIVFPSTLALPFHIALVFLRVSASRRQGAYSHTEKTHAWSETVERARAAACSTSKFLFRNLFFLISSLPREFGCEFEIAI